MPRSRPSPMRDVVTPLYRPHPWHGVPIGENAPEQVTVFIEIVPTDTVKYELDKPTGFLKLDRPQKFSNICPTLYGFIPQTYCGEESGRLCAQRTGRKGILGDGDPLDVCVLSERDISHGDILLQAIPIGGLRMIDGDQADDKIVATLLGDALFGGWHDIGQAPAELIERLEHYFLTYKQPPGAKTPRVAIDGIYGREEAHVVIGAARVDYDRAFASLRGLVPARLRG